MTPDVGMGIVLFKALRKHGVVELKLEEVERDFEVVECQKEV